MSITPISMRDSDTNKQVSSMHSYKHYDLAMELEE